MTVTRPRRSVLYMPGANERALEKAKTLAADCLIFDLEDSVAPDAKEAARARVAAAVGAGGYGPREVIIRVNGHGTEWSADDFAAIAAAAPDAILVPKVSTAADVAAAHQALAAAGAADGTALWAMMETPLAMLNARDIAATAIAPASRLAALVMGTNDLAKETGADPGAGRFAMLAWLSMCVAAAKAYGLAIIDGVYNDFRDEEGLEAECRQGRVLGMDGKTLIHPNQLAPCNAIFAPPAAELEWARKILAAFDQPENAAKGVISVDGRMVERLHAAMARRTVAIAEAIEKMENLR